MTARKKEINLLLRQDWESKPVIKVLNWSLTIGRYIVIITELVVIVSFVSRFKLDRDLSDLREEIEIKGARVKASLAFEKEFRAVQNKVNLANEALASKKDRLGALESLNRILPRALVLKKVSIGETKMMIEGYCLGIDSLATLITNLIKASEFMEIDLSSVLKDETGIRFELSTKYNFET